MFNLKQSLVALIAVLSVCAVDVYADSFVITNVEGTAYITTSWRGGPPTISFGPMLSLAGPGLSLANDLSGYSDPGNVEARDTCIVIPCTPGQVVGTNSTFSGLIASPLPSYASATVNGVSYPMVEFTGWLNFVSSPIVLPNFGSSPPVVTIPFTFSGELRGDAQQPDVVNPVFTATLSGQGVARFTFEDITYGTESPRYRLWSIRYEFGIIPILTDIKPATFPNRINPNNNGKLPVAILTTPSFDATAVDPATVLFGATPIEVSPVHYALEDVDGDGDIDMVLHFVTRDTGITCGMTSASLTGAIFGGHRIEGSDSILTVGCN